MSAVAVAEMSPYHPGPPLGWPVSTCPRRCIVSLALLGLLSLASPSEFPFPHLSTHKAATHTLCDSFFLLDRLPARSSQKHRLPPSSCCLFIATSSSTSSGAAVSPTTLKGTLSYLARLQAFFLHLYKGSALQNTSCLSLSVSLSSTKRSPSDELLV